MKKANERLDALMVETNDLAEALKRLDAEIVAEALSVNPDAETWCNRCGCRVRLDETDEYGNCC